MDKKKFEQRVYLGIIQKNYYTDLFKNKNIFLRVSLIYNITSSLSNLLNHSKKYTYIAYLALKRIQFDRKF